MVIAALAFVVGACGGTGNAPEATSASSLALRYSGSVRADLIAGQHHNIGEVTAEVVGDDILLTYRVTAANVRMKSGKIWLWESDQVGRPANPGVPGTVDNWTRSPAEAEYSKLIDVGDIECDDSGEKVYYIAAQTSVSGALGEQGAWSRPTVVPPDTYANWNVFKNGNPWGWFFALTVTCTEEPEEPGEIAYECDSAWAKDPTEVPEEEAEGPPPGPGSTCFQTIETGNNKWGWSNGAYDDEVPTLELFAGAGNCRGGVSVGHATLTFDDGAATAVLDLRDGAYATEAHLYVGTTPLPSGTKGNPTAPGQFPAKAKGDDVRSVTQEDVPPGPLYVLLHLDVCYPVHGKTAGPVDDPQEEPENPM